MTFTATNSHTLLLPMPMPMPTPDLNHVLDLSGLTIVVTRPWRQAEASAHWLRSLGATVVLFPVLEIEALSAATIDKKFSVTQLRSANAIIFVSANAAEYGAAAIEARGGFPPHAAIFAIGNATQAGLAEHGLRNIQCPAVGNDSEALLALPELQNLNGKQILIVRGASEGGGRTFLQDTLRTRGAQVSPLECYVRGAVKASADARHSLEVALQAAQARGAMPAFSVLSVETLESLWDNLAELKMAGGLHECMMLVPHSRVAAAAHKMGFTNVSVVPMGGESLHAALLKLKPVLLENKGPANADKNPQANLQMNPK